MAKLDKAQLARKDLVDMIRTRVRLEHRIAARRELNDLEDEALQEFERRLSSGEAYELESSYEEWVDAAARQAKETDEV